MKLRQLSAAAFTGQRFWRGAMVIFFVALALRGLHLWQLHGTPAFDVLVGDGRVYDGWAREIAAGDRVGDRVFYQAPMYPYFLGAIYTIFGHDLLAVRIIQAVLGSLACVMLAYAGRRFFSDVIGLVAGLLLATYAPAIFFDGLIQKSALDAPFLCAALWILGESLHKPRKWKWLLAGAAIGCLILTRENAAVFALAILAWVPLDRAHFGRRRLLFAGLFLAGCAVTLLPVGLRNQIVGGEFHLTTSQFGPNFYIGNNPDADGTYRPLRYGRGAPEFERQDATELAEHATGRDLTPAQVSRHWTGRALEYITSQPGDWLLLMLRKCDLLLNATEQTDSEDQYTYAQWSLPLHVMGWVFHFGVIAPLAVLGIVLTWSDRRKLWLLYLMLGIYAASVVLFYVFARYRYPLVPLLILFAAAGLVRFPGAVRDGRSPRLVIGVIGMIVLAVISNRPSISKEHMRAATYFNIGASLSLEGETEQAVEFYRDAIEYNPAFAEAHTNLATALASLGKTDEAIEHFEQALHLQPNDLNAHRNYAQLLLRERRLHEAIEHFRETVRINPLDAALHFELGEAVWSSGDSRAALPHLDEAIRLHPEFPQALTRAAWILATDLDDSLRDGDRAVELAQRANVLTNGQNPLVLDTLAAAFAERGEFEKAIEHAEAALAIVTRDGAIDLANSIRARLGLYRNRTPYRER